MAESELPEGGGLAPEWITAVELNQLAQSLKKSFYDCDLLKMLEESDNVDL